MTTFKMLINLYSLQRIIFSAMRTVEGNGNHLSGNQLRREAELVGRSVKHGGKIVHTTVGVQEAGLISTGIQGGYVDTGEIMSCNVSHVPSNSLGTQRRTMAQRKEYRDSLKWVKNDLTAKDECTWNMPNWLQNDKEPVAIFDMFFDDEVMSFIVESTVNYAHQQSNITFTLDINELRIFLGILFLSGYCTMSCTRMYWETADDTHQTMSRNHFEEILQYFYACDNTSLDSKDKFSKVRPIWSMLNERWLLAFPQDANLSIDESMCPYFGRHGCKQPIRFGYKIWCICTHMGYVIQVNPIMEQLQGIPIQS